MSGPTIIQRKDGNGEYSTVVLPNGVIETVWFRKDGSSIIVGRTAGLNVIAREHIDRFENPLTVGIRVRVQKTLHYDGQEGVLIESSDDPEDFWDWNVTLDSGRVIGVFDSQVVVAK